jgi:DNA-binding transcriptional LysR family regulator
LIETQQLRHLIAVIDHGTLLSASKAVNISQSGLSRSISALEERLGVQLVVRHPSGVEPTAYGAALVRRARLIMKDLADSIDELQAMSDGQSGELKLGITPSFTRHMVPKVVATIAAARPGLRISVFVAPIAALMTKLRRGEIDVGFGMSAGIDAGDDIAVERLAPSQSVVVARPGHPLCGKEKITVADLANARWVLIDGQELLNDIADFFTRHGHTNAPPPLKTSSLAFAKCLITFMDALTIMQRRTIEEEIEDERLFVLDCPMPIGDVMLVLAYRRQPIIGTPLKLLMDALRTAAAPSSSGHFPSHTLPRKMAQ